VQSAAIDAGDHTYVVNVKNASSELMMQLRGSWTSRAQITA